MSRYDEAIRFLRDPSPVTLAPGTPDEVIERLARQYARGVFPAPLASYGPRSYPGAARSDARPA